MSEIKTTANKELIPKKKNLTSKYKYKYKISKEILQIYTKPQPIYTYRSSLCTSPSSAKKISQTLKTSNLLGPSSLLQEKSSMFAYLKMDANSRLNAREG